MRKLYPRLAPILAFALATMHAATAQGPYALLHSLFDPGTNAQAGAQQGESVAVDGNIAVTGVPGDDVGGANSGQVKVYYATTGVLLLTLANPSQGMSGFFGQSVAISGTRIAVGAPSGGPAYVYDIAGATPTVPITTLTNHSPTASYYFGSAVAISGTRVVVGSPYDNIGASRAGSAHVYDLGNVTPTVPIATLNNPNPAQGDNFGWSVAISDTWVVIGAWYDYTGAIEAGSAYVYDLASATPTLPVATLANPSPAGQDTFGISVAMSGTRVVVGASGDDTGAANAGTAYVYDLSSAAPTTPTATLTNPSPAAGDYFASAVAISGARVVVGAYGDDAGATDSGSAYVYDLGGATLTIPITTLTNPSPASSDMFGYAVAISGARVVVGAHGDDTSADFAGAAYSYDLDSVTPKVPVTTLATPSPAANNRFGYAVAISGTIVAVGARYDSTGGNSAGTAYVYDLASAMPMMPVAVLTNPNPASSDWFGYAVAVSAKRVVIGGFAAGSAYVYDLANATPTVPVVTLTNPNPAASDYFGSALAISGARVVVGAYADDTLATDSGGAYVYDLASVTPTLPLATLVNPSPRTGDAFGYAVAISGTHVVVGAPGDSTGAIDAGSAYIYELSSGTPPLSIATLTNPSPVIYDYFGHAVAISTTRVVIGAYGDGTGSGSAYVYDLDSATPAVPAVTLTNPNPAASDWFGFSVAISGARVVVGAYYDDTGSEDAGSAYVYDLASVTPTVPVTTLTNPNPAEEDYFGFAVAVDGTFVVASAPYDDTTAPDRGAAYIFGPKPALNIFPVTLGLATIAWTPATSSGFLLQYTDSLAPSNWVNAPSGAANPVTVPTTNASRFYRLFQP